MDSIDQLHAYINKSRENQAILNDVLKIEIFTNKERLKDVTIVDTPGLNTITKANAERTESYIAQADVILWVLNSNHLGQTDVVEKIEEVMDYGKPIICIANRTDEIQGGADKIKNYIREEMGYMFREIFVTSARMAWDGIISGNQELIEKSNVNTLYYYLTNHIERNSKQIQLESAIESINTQIARDIQLHKNIKERLNTLINDLESNIRDLKQTSNTILKMVYSKLDYWAETEFFSQEKRLLLESRDADTFEKRYKMYCNSEYLNEIIQSKNNSLADYLYNEWKNCTSDKTQQIHMDVNSFISSVPQTSTTSSSKMPLSTADIAEGAIQMGMKAGALGLGLAVAGAALPTITFGTALSAICPPLLVV